MSDTLQSSKLHVLRAWPLLAFSVLCYFITSSVASSMNIASTIIGDARGWDPVVLTSMISVASIGNVILGFVAGRICVKHSPKTLCFIWGALYVLGLAAMGTSKAFSLFLIAMIVANATASAWGYNTVPVLLTNWFPMRKGTVQGLVSMGIPLGAGFAAMVYNFGFKTWGVDGAFIPFVIIAAVTLVLLAFGISDTPEQRGLTPDTMEYCKTSSAHEAQAAGQGFEPSSQKAIELIKNPRFMVLSIILGFQLLYAGGLMVQIVPRLFELGYSMDEAVADMLISAGFACVGSVVCGVIGDKFGSRTGVILTFILGIVGVLCNLLGNHVAVIASLAIIGIVTGSADNWPVNICAEYYGRDGFANTFGIMLPVIQIVGAFGPMFFAQIAGISGTYALSYIGGAVLMGIGLAVFILLTKDGMLDKSNSALKDE
ncbi:MFS transporter [Atopobium fossor]|uniref:MFS transporter n=1 Tax=Atopobium fossor TaxID=39487 RepID=UPI000418BEB9|nr:MFS transporter [Atopobium fossor]